MRRTVTAVVAVLSCVLSGCGGDAESDDSPASPSSSASPSDPFASSTDTAEQSGDEGTPGDDGPDSGDAPSLPDAARKNTLEGAEAFIRHYIDLLNYASDTGDTEALREASGGACGGCEDYADLYEMTYERGGFFRRGDWVPQPQVAKHRHEGTVRLVVTVDSKPGSYRHRSSAPTQAYGRNQYSLTFVIDRRSDQWFVRQFDGNET